MRPFRRLQIREDATPAEVASALRLSQLQALRQRRGQESEDEVERELLRRGLRLVEHVEVPFGILKDGTRYPKRKVSGDYRAVEPGSGRSVLIESKSTSTTDRLGWGSFREHQPVKLDEHMMAGGITEVAWTDRGVLRFIPWARFREIGFGPGKTVVWNGTTIEIYNPSRGKKTTTTF